MLILLRIIFTAGFIYCIVQARKDAAQATAPDDLTNAFWLAIGVLTGLACAATWAPFLGAKVADPLTGGWTESPLEERKNRLLQAIRWLDKRKRHRLVRWLCFLEGVRAPWLPTAFIIGLKNARPGSWLEKVYAREVYRFNNTENCVAAFEILKRHGEDPGVHDSPEVNLALVGLDRGTAPERPPLVVPAATPPAKPRRDERIRIGGR